MVKYSRSGRLPQSTAIYNLIAIWVVALAEFNRILQLNRIWQNSIAQQNLAEFYSLIKFGKIWQNFTAQQNLAESSRNGRLPQVAAKLQSHAQSLLAESVETGSGVSRVCFINITLIVLVVYRWQPQKKSCQCWE